MEWVESVRIVGTGSDYIITFFCGKTITYAVRNFLLSVERKRKENRQSAGLPVLKFQGNDYLFLVSVKPMRERSAETAAITPKSKVCGAVSTSMAAFAAASASAAA